MKKCAPKKMANGGKAGPIEMHKALAMGKNPKVKCK